METKAQREAGSCPRSHGKSELSPGGKASPPYSCDIVWECSAWAGPEEEDMVLWMGK